jgi:hypothetical protein
MGASTALSQRRSLGPVKEAPRPAATWSEARVQSCIYLTSAQVQAQVVRSKGSGEGCGVRSGVRRSGVLHRSLFIHQPDNGCWNRSDNAWTINPNVTVRPLAPTISKLDLATSFARPVQPVKIYRASSSAKALIQPAYTAPLSSARWTAANRAVRGVRANRRICVKEPYNHHTDGASM